MRKELAQSPSGFRIPLCVLICTVLVGCDSDSRVVKTAGCDFKSIFRETTSRSTSDPPIGLIACPLKTRVQSGEVIPVAVLLYNRESEPVVIRSRLEWGDGLYALVVGPRGDTLRLQFEPGHLSDRLSTTTLARTGIIGRIVGLNCHVGDFGAAAIGWDTCDSAYDLKTVGRYSIILAYRVECGPQCGADSVWVGELTAEEFSVEVAN